ncbi:MAG: hypothetical protein K0R55_4552, partial [Sporomusa sp.]|nr:hypothetical protein [Sporomusa sp.]
MAFQKFASLAIETVVIKGTTELQFEKTFDETMSQTMDLNLNQVMASYNFLDAQIW